MKGKSYCFPPILAIILGLAAAAVRCYELITGFDLGTQLMAKNHLPSYALIGFTLVCVFVFFVISRMQKPLGGDEYAKVFRIEGRLGLSVSVVSVMILFLAATIQFREYLQGSILYLVMSLFTLFAAVCLFITISARRNSGKNSNIRIYVIAPIFWACYILIIYFSEVSTDPVVLYYIYDLFGYIFVLLSLYSMAAFSFGREKPRFCIFYMLSSTFFSVFAVAGSVLYALFQDGATLADALSEQVVLIFAALYMPLAVTALLKNMRRLDLLELPELRDRKKHNKYY